MNVKRKPQNGLLETPLPAVDEPEGQRVPSGLPLVVDAHVHLFPDDMFAAVWQWFDRYGWPVRYRFEAERVVDFLTSRGVGRLVGLAYAHKPGVARGLNKFMGNLCRRFPQVRGLATVFPGESEAGAILREAFESGLGGVKLHNHVQCFDINGAGMQTVYETCCRHDKPLLMHVGREPKSPAYPCDPYEFCRADKLEEVLRQFPRLKICVPHLGADEFGQYRRLIEAYDNLWLDTTMTQSDYLPFTGIPALSGLRADRIMYGTDFPNVPYAWDRELKKISALGLSASRLRRLLGQNAAEFYGIVM